MLNRILAVIRREYLERVRTKAFWISTILVPIFLGAGMILPACFAICVSFTATRCRSCGCRLPRRRIPFAALGFRRHL